MKMVGRSGDINIGIEWENSILLTPKHQIKDHLMTWSPPDKEWILDTQEKGRGF